MVRSDNNNPAVIEGVLPATLQGGWKGELLNMRKDGTEFPVYISTSVVCNDRGEPVALMGVASDITENKMFEEALRESETKYRSLFDGARDAIFIMNNQCFLDCNRSTGSIFGVTADQIIGASPTDYSPTYSLMDSYRPLKHSIILTWRLPVNRKPSIGFTHISMAHHFLLRSP